VGSGEWGVGSEESRESRGSTSPIPPTSPIPQYPIPSTQYPLPNPHSLISKTQRLNSHLGDSAFEKVPTINKVEANFTGVIRVGFAGFPAKNRHFYSILEVPYVA